MSGLLSGTAFDDALGNAGHDLKERGCLQGAGHGVWRVTDAGRAYANSGTLPAKLPVQKANYEDDDGADLNTDGTQAPSNESPSPGMPGGMSAATEIDDVRAAPSAG